MGIIVELYPARFRRPSLIRSPFADVKPPQPPRRRFAPAKANAPLDCLAGGALASRFHAWHGGSGRRYVCSVYPVQSHILSTGLPDFDGAVAIGVMIDEHGRRARASVFELCRDNARLAGRCKGFDAALEAGVEEWHVHLLAASPAARRAMILDLESR